MPLNFELDALDTPIYGVTNFARVLGRTRRQVYDDLEKKRLDGFAKKWGKVWVSTPRRLLQSLEPAETDRNSA